MIKLNRLYSWGLFALFLIIPLLVIPQSFDSYIIPKMAIMEIITLWLAGVYIWEPPSIQWKKNILQNSAIIPFFLWVVWNGISLLWAKSLTLAEYDLAKWIFLFLLYLVILRAFTTPSTILQIGSGLLLAGGLTSLWVIFQDYHILGLDILARLPDWRGYLVGGMGNSDYVAGFLASLFPLAFFLYLAIESRIGKYLFLAGLALSYAALIVTYSVGSNGGLIIGFFLAAILAWQKRDIFEIKKKLFIKRLSLLAGLLILVTAFYVIPNPWNGRGQSIFQQAFGSERWKEGGSTRVVIWLNTIEIIKAHPVLGVGTGNFTFRYLDTVAPKVLAVPHYRFYSGEYTNAAHNELMQAWAETGLIGMLLLFSLVMSYYWLAWKAWKIVKTKIETGLMLGSIGGITALAGYGMMSYPFHLPAACLSFLLLISIPSVILMRNTVDKVPVTTASVPVPPAWFRILKNTTILILLIVVSVWLFLPLWAEIEFKQGKTELAYGDMEAAMDHFDKASSLADHADAQFNMAEIYLKQGQFDEALKYYLKSAEKRKDKNVYYGLAMAYYLKGDGPGAVPYLETLVFRTPQNPMYWKMLWLAYLKSGDDRKAEQAHREYEKLSTASPFNPYQ
jgi:O-antigen ligase